jgi:hypothetical protein
MMIKALFTLAAAVSIAAANALAEQPEPMIRVLSFQPVPPICRALRPAAIEAVIANKADVKRTISVQLAVPEGVRVLNENAQRRLTIGDASEATVRWTVQADRAGTFTLTCLVDGTQAQAAVRFEAPVPVRKASYVPEPKPVRTDMLVGAHNCPLWEADKPFMWANVLKHPERTPALGFYAQENPEVTDWETKWAVEHGVNFFIYCWYRDGQGGPVRQRFGSAIHDALLKSRYVGHMKFTIMWENQARGVAGVADERDLMENLLPFWIENYFKHPSYLKVDGKPLLFIYRPEFLVDDLGGVANVRRAFDRMREACRKAGFEGLWLLGEYRGLDPKHFALMQDLGLDYTFAYCWYVPNNPTPEQSIAAQMDYIRKTQDTSPIPQVITVSQAWSGWNDEGTIWKIPPAPFETLLRKAKQFARSLPSNQLGSRMLLLDNWNEWGEGHYIAPYREYGFGYLDAVRRVFSDAPDEHVDLIPEDVGMGPYDTAYRKLVQQDKELKEKCARKVVKPGADAPGLLAWWTFDEPANEPVAFDYSGHRLGGIVRKARRTAGISGSALLCDGGCVAVPPSPLLSVTDALTLECWVKTEARGQKNNWIINRVLQGGTSTGYRLGLLDDRPCFEIPQTDWSHHLTAPSPLPTGKWVHVVGTFDGSRMRLYVDGVEVAAMDRPGPIKPNAFRLHLGTYEEGHQAHFTGALDEVRIYGRALSPSEVAARHRAGGRP